MNEQTSTLEMRGFTVDEAIAKGLEQLGLTQDEVEVEIIEEGSRGLFGLGARQALVRITVKQPHTGAPPTTETTSQTPPQTEPEKPAESPTSSATETETAPPEPAISPSEEEQDEVLTIARETVQELLDKMHIQAKVTTSYLETEGHHRKPGILVEINGKDLSILIGRKAETLNALQLITRLMVGKELSRSVNLLVDVQGYRKRRKEQLTRLARKMADQAIRTGKRQTLEPMPPYERRIVHLELRDNPHVETLSVGEDPRRKVTIIPK